MNDCVWACAQSICLAIVMELCRFGSLFKVIGLARRVSHLPPDVRSDRIAPRNADEGKLKASAIFLLHLNFRCT